MAELGGATTWSAAMCLVDAGAGVATGGGAGANRLSRTAQVSSLKRIVQPMSNPCKN